MQRNLNQRCTQPGPVPSLTKREVTRHMPYLWRKMAQNASTTELEGYKNILNEHLLVSSTTKTLHDHKS